MHIILKSAGLQPRMLSWLVAAALIPSSVPADDKVTYDDHVAPILRQRCGTCHNPTEKKSGLDVTTYFGLMQGGASGTVIEGGDAASSYLFSLVAREAEPFMPPNADKIPDGEIDTLRRWIDGGALENAGSKAIKPKAKMSVAVEIDPGKRPDVIPMPLRMVLEPHYRPKRPPMARSLATSPWAPLAAVTSQRQVLLYNTSTLDLVGVLPFPEGQPHVVRFSRDGALLLAGGGRPAASGKVVVWDVTTGERVFEIGNELDVVLAADISADHKRIAIGGPQRMVRVYSTESGELLYEIAKHTDWVLAVEFSPDGVLLASADRNGGLFVFESHTGNEYLTLNGHTAAVTAVSWRGDSNLLASASEDASVRLWELENGTQVKTWSAKAAVLSLEFARDGRLVTSGRDQITRLWNQDGGQTMETPPIGDVAVSATYCDESSRAIAASLAGPVQVYNASDAAALESLATNLPSLEERLAAAEQNLKAKTELSAPLVEAVRKAEIDLNTAQTALATAQKDATALQLQIEKLSSEVAQIGESRAASDAERAKISATISQVEAARPLVGEALRHITEALGKQPDDAKLVDVHRQVTEQLQSMEKQSADLQAKLPEVTAAIASADATLQDTNASLANARKESTAASERVKASETQTQQLTAALDSARQAAQPAEEAAAQAQREVARWRDEIAFRDQMAALQNELAAARKLAAERESEVNKANEQLSAAQTTLDSAKVKLDESSHSVDAINAKINDARGMK